MDFSLTTVVVVPQGVALKTTGNTQDLLAGEVGFFTNAYAASATPNTAPYFYIAQGRTNTYLQGTKRSDKIAGLNNTGVVKNVTDWRKVVGCTTPKNQITEIDKFSVQCGEDLTITLRGFSSYLNTLYFNGWTKSVTVSAPCCDCGSDPCADVDVPDLIAKIIEKFTFAAPGTNPDNIKVTDFYDFSVSGTGAAAKLVIEGKPLTKYGVPCDVAAFPFEYDKLRFNVFAYKGPETTADFIVYDNCDVAAEVKTTQESSYVTGSSDEILQLEKNFYSYQAGYLKSLYRMAGYNQNFETWTKPGVTYDTYYIRFNEYDKSSYMWGDYIPEDSTVILAVPQAEAAPFEAALVAALGPVTADNAC
jgi:hypothetical protein